MGNFEGKNQLALSNSQLTLSFLHNYGKFISQLCVEYGYINCYLDRLTIIGNATEKLFEIISKEIEWDITIYHNERFKGQLFKGSLENFYVEYDNAKAEAFKIRNFRIEFNPNLARKAQLNYVFTKIVPNLTEVGITRIDIAFDFERNLSRLQLENAISKQMHYGKGGKIETIYFGSPKSDYQIRIYDKQLERNKKGTQSEKDYYNSFGEYWRLEFQLNGAPFIEQEVRRNFEVLSETKITKRNYDLVNSLSVQEKIHLFVKDYNPDLFSQLGSRAKAKYNGISKKVNDVNLSDIFRPAITEIVFCSDRPTKTDLKYFCERILQGRNPWEQGCYLIDSKSQS